MASTYIFGIYATLHWEEQLEVKDMRRVKLKYGNKSYPSEQGAAEP